MPWCPKCRVEYVDGIKMCSDCHVELVDECPEAPEYMDTYEGAEPVLVVIVPDEAEAARLEALLAERDIPAIRRLEEPPEDPEEGAAGIGLYVPERLSETALRPLRQDDAASGDESAEYESEAAEYSYSDTDDEIEEYVAQGKGLGGVVIAILIGVAILAVWLFTRFF
ncbi:hypothetical protein FACS1894191_7780 [Clostridia bacterium]|nr:hypothetical protein FACS1894191_7780 [Clostridia bacterium]